MYNIETENQTNIESLVKKVVLSNFLRNDILNKIISENPGSQNLPEVVEDIMGKSLTFPHIEKAELTGSIARFAIGFGTMEKYNQGKDGATELLKVLNTSKNINNFENNPWKKIITDLSESDMDMDTCFYFVQNYSLFDLYNFLKEQYTKSENFKIEKSDNISAFSLNLMDNFHLEITHEPIHTNPGLKKLTIGIAYKSEGDDYKQIMHIDVSESPTDALKARKQKRHGGRTTKSQDRGRVPLVLENGQVIFKRTDNATTALRGKERISTTSKKITDIFELSMRSLRIRSIHTPKDLSIKVNRLFPLFDSKSIFSIRKDVQEYIATKNHNISLNEISLSLKDLILCFNFDPYNTLHFLQDSNFYVLFPGLNNMTSKGWRNLYLNDHLNLTTTGGDFVESDKRSLNSIANDQNEYSNRKLSNGFISVLQVISEIKDPKNEFNLLDSFNHLDTSLVTKFDSKKIKTSEPIKAIFYILKFFNGGLTEKEIQRIYNLHSIKKIGIDEFRKALRELKLNSKIDKQLRTANIAGKDKLVTLYNLRSSKQENPLHLDYLLERSNLNTANPCLDRTKKYLNDNNKNLESVNKTLINIQNFFKRSGVSTLEAFRSFSKNDFSDMYEKYYDEYKVVLSSQDFQVYCRAIQIITEDVLRYPQFINYLRLDLK